MIAGLEGGTYVYPIRVRLDIPSPSSTTLIVR